MRPVRFLFWFDTEDCMVPQSDDVAKRLAEILEERGVTGTFKIVGQKARVMRERIRYKVLDALMKHDIGYHSNWHGGHPQPVEYLADKGWSDGVDEFRRRETEGIEDVRRILEKEVVTYGQPGPNWAPQAFPVLREWGVPTYVSGFSYVGLDAQPYRYCGIPCMSHLFGKRLSGESQRHAIGLNFECGKADALDGYKKNFARSVEQLSATGGLISVMNHPCTFVLESWFDATIRPRSETQTAYENFTAFVDYMLSFDNVRPTCASELPEIYPDLCEGHSFTRDELRLIARGLTDAIDFVVVGDRAVSAAEAFWLVVSTLAEYVRTGEVPIETPWRLTMNPTVAPDDDQGGAFRVSWSAFCNAVNTTRDALMQTGAVPDAIAFEGRRVAPGDFLGAAVQVLGDLIDGAHSPDMVRIEPAALGFAEYVDEEGARASWKGAMYRHPVEGERLLELTRLGAWTVKPAIALK